MLAKQAWIGVPMRKTTLGLLLFLAVGILVTSPLMTLIPAHGAASQTGEGLGSITSENPHAVQEPTGLQTALTTIWYLCFTYAGSFCNS